MDAYHRNLSEWVDSKLASGVSLRTLARLLTEKAQAAGIDVEIGYGAVFGWKAGRLKGRLEFEKVRALALYEGIPPEEMLRQLQRNRKDGERGMTREQVVQWVKRSSLRDVGFVGIAVAERFTQEVGANVVALPDNSPDVNNNKVLENMAKITLQPFADLRLSIILRRSLQRLGLTYSAVAAQSLEFLGESQSSAYLQDLKILTALIRKIAETRYRSTPIYSEKYFKAIAALCFRIDRWESDEPVLRNTQYGGDYQILIADLERVSNGNGIKSLA